MIWFILIVILLVIIFSSRTREANKSVLSSGSPVEPEPERISSIPEPEPERISSIPVVDQARVRIDTYNNIDNSVLDLKTPLLKPVLSIPDPDDSDYYSKLNDYNLQERLKT